jgi:hypothetical protein
LWKWRKSEGERKNCVKGLKFKDKSKGDGASLEDAHRLREKK